MGRHWTLRWLAAAALAAALPRGLPAQAPRADGTTPPAAPLRHTRNVPGDGKPLVIAADEVFTWVEGGRRVVVARGQVWLQQSVVQVRCRSAVVWADIDRLKKTGVLHADVYAEGQVRLDTSTKVEDGDSAVVELNTRGELRLNAYRSKVRQESLAGDAGVERARQALGQPTAAPAPAMPRPPVSAAPPPEASRPAVAAAPPPAPATPPPPPPGEVRRTSFEEAAPPAGGTPGTPVQRILPATPPPPPEPSPAVPKPPGPAVVVPPGDRGGPPAQLPLPPPSRPARPAPGRTAFEGPGGRYTVAPRGAGGFDTKNVPLANGEQAIIVTSGVIVNVRNVKGIGLLDIEADRLVIWTKSAQPQQLLDGDRPPNGRDVEFYLSGNVEIRQQSDKDSRVLRADEVYYDINRNTALALNARLEIKDPKVPDPVIVRAPELQQLAANQYQVFDSEVFSSKLPSDPGLKVYFREATIEDVKVPQVSIFGRQVIDRATGQPAEEAQTRVVARNVFFEVLDVPVFYTPYLAGDARDPLGPLQSISLGYNQLFGFQAGLSFDAYELLGIQPYKGTRWRLDLDYLSERGPGLGTQYDYAVKDLFGVPSSWLGVVKGYAMYDDGFDQLGGPAYRNSFWDPPNFRGRFLWRQAVADLPYGFTVQSQVHAISDHNFLEQYYKFEFDRDLPPDTYLYVKQQDGQFAWTGLVQPRLLNWVTTAEALPRLDGHVIGQSFFDLFTYNASASAGYFQLRPTSDPYPPLSETGPRPVYPPGDIRNFFPRVSPTDVYDRTARFDLTQELSLPFTLGAFRVVPYGTLSLTEYTNDLNGDETGRAWGGGGVRASIPFSRLYPEVQSELFNVNGIYHKMTLSGNYFVARANEPYTNFPQLDRFNDHASDQAVRDIRAFYLSLYPTRGQFMATSPLFDPQVYAIRRLITSRIDTRDDIEVVQLDLLQRWQTKRGYPGAQHVIDWMVLDLSGSYFPDAQRDNFGEPFAFLEYDYLWNVGDRTAITSHGWVDPIDDAARVFVVGTHFNRPDRTSFYLGYRHTDPLDSRVVTASVTYVFSPKYALTANAAYDFGTQASLSNSLIFTRIGTDVQVSLGIQYNSLQDNLGFTFEIFPNLVPQNRRTGGTTLGQGGLFGRR